MKKQLLTFLFALVLPLSALDVSGRVISETGSPLENVVLSTSETAVITDQNGVFFIKGISNSTIIKVHRLGFVDLEYPAAKLPTKIILSQKSIELDGITITEKASTKLPLSPDIIVIEISDNQSYQNAAEILSNRADLQMSGTNLHGETQNVSIPGYQTRHTLVMLDGIPLNKTGDAFDIASIPAEIIQSIEIMKGSSGSIAGSGSMGGIININTKRAAGKLSASYKHGFGSFGLDKHTLSFSGRNSRWNGFLLLGKSYSRNDFHYEGHESWPNPDSLRTREHNDKEIYDVSLNLGHSNQYLNANYKLIIQDYFKKLPGTILNPDYYKNSRQTGQTFRHFLELSKAMKSYNLKANVFYTKESSTYDNTRLDSLYNTALYRNLGTTDQLSRGVKLLIEFKQPGFYFEWGVDYKFESFSYQDELNAANSISTKSLEDYGIFGNTKLERYYYPSRLELNASSRWDHSDRFKSFTSWRLAPQYTYETMFDIIVGGNVANAFSYPSFLSVYWKGDTQATGNPDLKQEESLSWQIFSKLDFGKHFLKVAYRQDKLKNMIVWFLEHNSKWKPDNIGKARIDTWEFETEFQPMDFVTISGIYVLINAKNLTKDSDLYNQDIVYTPYNKLSLQAKINVEHFSGILTYNRTGKQAYTPDQQSAEQFLDAYDLVNVSLNYKFYWNRFQLTVGMNGNNLFDKLYEVYKYIPQPGFNWDVNVGVKWEL
jgi:vitamin B12 transporter